MNTTTFEEQGYAVAGPLVSEALCGSLISTLSRLPLGNAGSRSLLEHAWCAELAGLLRSHPLIAPLLSRASVAVQCNYFEKSTSQNWLVAIHQDLSIAVKEKIEHPELKNWAEKEGAVFVQAPDFVLQELVAVRLHLDDCGPDDGPLRVVPGSHKAGRLANAEALMERERVGEVACPVERGGALIMKPLLLHASSKATGTSMRRVLHFVFGPPQLPYGLCWRRVVHAPVAGVEDA